MKKKTVKIVCIVLAAMMVITAGGTAIISLFVH